jgi:RHS repeat-associated protein
MKTLLIALLFLPAIASASDTWQSGEYRYDGAGNIIGIGNDSYVYDSVSRLSHAVVNTANESYVYDAFGNLVTKTTDGRLETVPPVDSSTNRITTASYDTAGNMTSSGEATYVYDPLNMMVRIDTSYARRRYIYTVDDERIGVQTDPTFTRWTVRDFGGKVLREFRADSINAWTWTEDYIYRDGQLVAAEQPGTSGGLRHFSLDHLGTTRLITNTPAPGETPVAYGRHDFFPFGMEQTPTNQEVVNHSSERPEAMKFTGHQRDFLGDWYTDNSDYLDYMHARYYNPVMGRFLSVDPVRGFAQDPQSWNRYTYALNNPIRHKDPTGRCTESIMCLNYGRVEAETTVTAPDPGPMTVQDLMATDLANGMEAAASAAGIDTQEFSFSFAADGAIAVGQVGQFSGIAITSGETDGILTVAPEYAYHYTFARFAPSIAENGLYPGTYLTPNGGLSPLQAQIDLALPPNRGLPDTLIRVNIGGLRNAGYEVPEPLPVGRMFNMPGGGEEMLMPESIPPEFFEIFPVPF